MLKSALVGKPVGVEDICTPGSELPFVFCVFVKYSQGTKDS
jgi:hypothetical protein